MLFTDFRRRTFRQPKIATPVRIITGEIQNPLCYIEPEQKLIFSDPKGFPMKVHNVIIRGFLVASCVIAFSGTTLAKNHPYNAAFESQVSTLMLENGRPSVAKINAYIARLEQKYSEVVGARNGILEDNSVLIGGARMDGKVDQAKLAKKLEESDPALALRSAINELEKAKRATTAAEVINHAYLAIDLENSIRIKGGLSTLQMISDNLAILSPWRVPLRSRAADEASNLFNPQTNSYLGAAELQGLIGKNTDLSVYEPKESTFWQPQNISRVNVQDAAMGKNLSIYRGSDIVFPANKTFIFDEVKYADTKPKFEVFTVDAEGKKTKFKLKFGAELHADPTLAALMMTMGFPADIVKYEKNIKVIIGEKTVADITRDWEAYYRRDAARKRFPIEKYILQSGRDPQTGNFIIFKEGVMEARPKNVGRLGGWSLAETSHDSMREVRGLMVIQTWLANGDVKDFDNNRTLIRPGLNGSVERVHILSDLGYALGAILDNMPELYSPTMVSSRSSSTLSLNYRGIHKNPLRNKITFADLRWATRLIGSLSREQITEAVRIGGWPACIQKIYVEKMIMRRNDLLRHTGLVGVRQKDGSTLQLISEPIKMADLNFDKVCDVKTVESEYTSNFNFNAAYILKPVGRMAWNFLLDQARALASGPKKIVLSGKHFDTRLQGIVEVLINPGEREIERNMNPTGPDDLYIVKDTVEIGFRSGVSYGAYVDSIVKRVFTLSYPARTMEEARVNNGFIFNVLLIDDVANRRVPQKYVLKTEHYVESGVGIDFDTPISPAIPVTPGIKAGVAKVRVLRTVLDHRDANKILLFRDTSRFTQDQLELFVKLSILKIPLFETVGQHDGKAFGRAMSISSSEIQRMPDLLRGIKVATVHGDFSNVQDKERNLYVQNDFSGRQNKWGFLMWKGQSERRLEYITLQDENNAANNRTVLQGRNSRSNSTAFLENNEARSVKVEVYSNSAQRPDFQIKLQVLGSDSKTSDSEMSNVFLKFINGFSTTGRKLINFTPELGYTMNKQWGSTITQSVTNFYQAGIDRILNMTEDTFLRALAANIGQRQLVTYEQPATPEERDSTALVRNARKFLSNVRKVNKADGMQKKVERLATLFREAVYTKPNGFYDSRIIGAVNRVAGTDNLYARHVISAPGFAEQNLVEETPLFAEVGKERLEERQYIMYVPQTATDLYFMFDSWF